MKSCYLYRKKRRSQDRLTRGDLLSFVRRLSKAPCERWYDGKTCLTENDKHPCWPCQARRVLKGAKK